MRAQKFKSLFYISNAVGDEVELTETDDGLDLDLLIFMSGEVQQKI